MNHVQISAISQEMVLCHSCHTVSKVNEMKKGYSLRCPRCRAAIHLRKTNSISRTWAFVVLGFCTFIPSHIFPIMTISQLGTGTYQKTIIGGILRMVEDGFWGLGLILFVASVVVPLLKLVGLTVLLLAIQRKKLKYRFRLTQAYRIIVFIGRWSMVDIFFGAVFVSLLQIGSIVNVQIGFGATAFASMCIITIIAGEFFDPRLLWDHHEGE